MEQVPGQEEVIMKGKMKAAVFEGIGKLTVKEVDIPEISSMDQVLIEIEACSICGTDVHIMAVPPSGFEVEPGLILGHEIVGRIAETGSGVIALKKGDRVVVEPNDYCSVCSYCLKGLTNHCENQISIGVNRNGGFAEYVIVTEKVAHKIADDLPRDIAVFAEPLACVLNGFQKTNILPGQSTFVVGAGPIALIFVQMLKAAGASPIIVSEPSESRRGYAKKCGADYILNPFETSNEEFVKSITGTGADVVIDVVGSQISECIKAVRHGGRILAFGFNTRAEPKIVQHQLILKEITILGTWIAKGTFPGAVQILEKGVLDLEKLITHVIPLESIHEGISLLAKGEGLEIIVTPK
jgi:2-desacetyl-2-hydroxyethyl bacteriochlorophyllide A dehydrogenase